MNKNNINIYLVPKISEQPLFRLTEEEKEIELNKTKQKIRDIIGKDFEASVEAVYGNYILEGTEITLDHHSGKYIGCPAPCNTDVERLKKDSIIIVSHIDLDALGGCLALMGIKPKDDKFWEAAEYIDVNGPHHMNELTEEQQDKLKLYTFLTENKYNIPSNIANVTDEVLEKGYIVNRIIDLDYSRDMELIEASRENYIIKQNEIENYLKEETDNVRIFVKNSMNEPFCNSSYYSSIKNKIFPYIITYTKDTGAITLSSESGGKELNCAEILKEQFGPDAGGHGGIGGSPRGVVMTMDDVISLAENIEGKLEKIKDNDFTL